MQAVYVPADDSTDLAPATMFAHLDATTVLSMPKVSVKRMLTIDQIISWIGFHLTVYGSIVCARGRSFE